MRFWSQMLSRAPSWLQRLARRSTTGGGPLSRIIDRVRYRYSPDEIPAPPEVRDAPVRVLIAPANFATQGFLWARAVEKHLDGVVATCVSSFGSASFRLKTDLEVPVAVHMRAKEWHAAYERFVLSQTHVIWEAGRPLFGRRFPGGIRDEAAWLRHEGIEGALMFHGSDVRLPSAHAATHAWSPFAGNPGQTPNLEEVARLNLGLAAQAEMPVFVSTPDLLQWIPEATWCPVVVDVERWESAASRDATGQRGRPVVVHAPSRPWLKGTDLIEPVLHALDAEGVIEYRQVHGVPHDAMPAFYADADVVLDQFVLGGYGVAACEAMAAGRVVMSHVDSFTRREVRERTGLELPIHETTLETLEADLRRFAAQPEDFASFMSAGPRFVREVHDGRRAAGALAGFLGSGLAGD